MAEDLEDELELLDWGGIEEWLICLLCGSPLEACDCEAQTPIPTPKQGLQHPFQCDVFFRIRKIGSD